MTLLSHIESQTTSNSTSNSKKKKKTKDSKDDSEAESTMDKDSSKADKEKKDGNYPAWKTKAPTDGESKVITRGDKKFYWCTKCRQGKGLWSRHSEEDHKSDYRPTFNNSRPSSRQSTNENSNNSTGNDPSIQVQKDLLNNAKAFLASRQDFQAGGTHD